jgi:hypothetical protein
MDAVDVFAEPNTIRVVQICPTNGGGVADFARILAERMVDQGLREITIPASWEGLSFPEGFSFDREHDIILLHFSGYEYGHRGMCNWLVKWVRDVQRTGQTRGIVTYFHELYAFGPPWRSAFYVTVFHRYFVFAVQSMSDKIFTNTREHVRRLRWLSFKPRQVVCLPVYSNVLEPANCPLFRDRSDIAVMFGIEQNRRRALRVFGGPAALTAHGIKEVIEIGPGASVCPNRPGWKFLGRLDKHDISRILLNARFGLVTHQPAQLAKSSVFAAYAAHGCVPLLPVLKGALPDGLRYGLNVISLTQSVETHSLAELGLISANISIWYAAHNSSVVAKTIIEEGFRSFVPAVRNEETRGEAAYSSES